jgi:ketosteroid isomerase-like protein
MEAFVVHELAGGRITRIRVYADLESARRAAAG